MNRARIIVLTIAIGAGGVAAYLASGSDNRAPQQAAQAVQIPTVEVLVAKADIGLGQTVTPNEMQWQTWPASAASDSFIRKNARPKAMEELTGSIARSPFVIGEPIREPKLIKSNGSGFMAAILPQGMRAVSTEISAESGAGGFILPNDHVDVILTKKERNPDPKATGDIVVSSIILANIRVLAIDQAPKEKDGQNNVVGRTATLELKPGQTATLAAARQAGTISLALRSIADVNQTEVAVDDRRPTGSINVVRYGVNNPTPVQK